MRELFKFFIYFIKVRFNCVYTIFRKEKHASAKILAEKIKLNAITGLKTFN